MIFDTTVLADLLRNNSDIKEKIKELRNKKVEFSTTTISVFEIWEGTKDTTEKQKIEIEELFESIPIIKFDKDSAKLGGLIQAALRKQGNMIEPQDCMIAGIAIMNNKKVLTRNIKHFSRIQNLQIETY